MAGNANSAAIRKRAQIARANRTMFLWIAASSAIVGAGLVVSYFLLQSLVYNEKVLFEKSNTVSVLNQNNNNAEELQNQVLILDTNEALASVKANEDDQSIQVVLDALPAEANSLALGASLQSKLLAGVSGLTIDSLQIEPVAGVETLANGRVVSGNAPQGSNAITFRFSVTGDQKALRKVLNNLERSIRQIDISTLRIESQGTKQTMVVQAQAYYEPAQIVELTNKVVKR